MKLPPLNTLRVFDAAARLGSFVRAAHELHVTHGAVSRQIRQLEQALGLALFERRNRAVFLTGAGHQLHATTAVLFEQLACALRQLQPPAADSALVVSCEPTIAMMWLIPRLPDFQRAHPDVRLHLYAAGGPPDFAAQGVDVALRRNDFPWDDTVHAEFVCDEWTGPVCHPELAARLAGGGVKTWKAAVQLNSATRPAAWKRWSLSAQRDPAGGGIQSYEHFYLSLQAAAAGLGVAIGSALMAQDALAQGRLAAPFGFVRDGSAYCLLSPRPYGQDARAVALLQWLRGATRASIEAVIAPGGGQSAA